MCMFTDVQVFMNEHVYVWVCVCIHMHLFLKCNKMNNIYLPLLSENLTYQRRSKVQKHLFFLTNECHMEKLLCSSDFPQQALGAGK